MGDLAGGFRDGVGGRCLRGGAFGVDDRLVVSVLFDAGDDAVHHPGRLDRVSASRRLRGKHHRVGAVEDGVGDVGGFGPGRPRRAYHR